MAHEPNETLVPPTELARAQVVTVLKGVPVRQLEFVRFNRLHRGMHACMIVSFISLALTGLSLKFSYTPWAGWLSRMLGGFQAAGFIHRTAAGIMFGTFIVHLVNLYKLKKHRYGSWRKLLFGEHTMIPNGRDFHEFLGTMKWFLHLGPR